MNFGEFTIDGTKKVIVNDVVNVILDAHEKYENMLGVILCEGTATSIDRAVYGCVFPDFLVLPLGGCTTVQRYFPKVRKILKDFGLYAYGIIDRDALSKNEIKRLRSSTGLYTTKLPFIENIICSPEVLEIVCASLSIPANEFIRGVELELMKILWQKLKETLPINLGIEKNERITSLRIGASTKRKTIDKEVTDASILYSYRDKVLTSLIATHLKLEGGKRAYYKYIADLTEKEQYKEPLRKAFGCFIPDFELYDLE